MGQGVNDFLGHAVTKVFLLRIGTHVDKRKHRNRRGRFFPGTFFGNSNIANLVFDFSQIDKHIIHILVSFIRTFLQASIDNGMHLMRHFSSCIRDRLRFLVQDRIHHG